MSNEMEYRHQPGEVFETPGFACPAGGLQDCAANINNKPAKLGKRRAIKYTWVS
jgi:hypothetical protein